MPATIHRLGNSKVVHILLSGKLTGDDYEQFVPRLEQVLKAEPNPRLLVEMEDFEGWTPGALWADLKFDARHFNDLEKVAFVGEKAWEKWMASVCKPFTTATVRYFEPSQLDEAHAWLLRKLPD